MSPWNVIVKHLFFLYDMAELLQNAAYIQHIDGTFPFCMLYFVYNSYFAAAPYILEHTITHSGFHDKWIFKAVGVVYNGK